MHVMSFRGVITLSTKDDDSKAITDLQFSLLPPIVSCSKQCDSLFKFGQRTCLCQNEGEATFQLVLVSNGETSYALYYYKEGGMKWTYRGSWSYIMIGVSDGNADHFVQNLYTKTERAYFIDSMTGNTGKRSAKGTMVKPRLQPSC